MSLLIAAIFDWKPSTDKDAASLGHAAVVESEDNIPPVNISLTLTLTKRRMSRYGAMSTTGWKLHDTTLAEEAFRSKMCSIRLEKGTFPVIGVSDGLCHWYSLHLVFDKSPYPPLEEWAQKRPAAGHEYWERKIFYRRQIEGDMYHGTGALGLKDRVLLKDKLAEKRAHRGSR